jgi:hypothetical protein
MPYIVEHVEWEGKYQGIRLRDGSIRFGLIGRDEGFGFLCNHSPILVECYIDPRRLIEIAANNGIDPSDLLRDQFLPDDPSIKSGDSGEILARSILQEWRDSPSFPALRWRDKAHKNDTVRGPDLIGYVIDLPPKKWTRR